MSKIVKIPDNILKKYFNSESYLNNNGKSKDIIKSLVKNNKIIVMGDVQSGKTSKLIDVIIERTKNNSAIVIYLTGNRNSLLKQNHKRFFDHFENINKQNNSLKYIVNKKIHNTDARIKLVSDHLDKGNTYITSELKLPKTLNNLYSFLSNFREHQIIIIDDEGDEASLSKVTKREIGKITRFPKSKYISITATPYRNLYDNEEFYDDFVVLERNNEYKGYLSFNKKNYVIVDEKLSNLQIIYQPLLMWAEISIENDIQSNTQILFNISSKIESHEEQADLISDFLQNGDLIKLYKKNYITKDIYIFLSSIDIENDLVVLNSKSADMIQNEHSNKINEGKKIIIGGINLSRGNTYENLIVEVMINAASKTNPATLLQRARWYGYGEIKNINKIYITKDIETMFEEIKDLNLWTENYKLGNDYKTKFDSKRYKKIQL